MNRLLARARSSSDSPPPFSEAAEYSGSAFDSPFALGGSGDGMHSSSAEATSELPAIQ